MYFLTVSTLVSPVSASQRRRLSTDHTLPSPASFSRTPCAAAIDRERAIVEQRLAAVPLDHHVDGVGAGQLLVEPIGRGERVLLVRDLIGEAVLRHELAVGEAGKDDRSQPGNAPDEGCRNHAADDRLGDPAKDAEAAIGVRLDAGGRRRLVRHEEGRERRHHHGHRDVGNADGQQGERARTCGSAPIPQRRTRAAPAPHSSPSAGTPAQHRAPLRAPPSADRRRP